MKSIIKCQTLKNTHDEAMPRNPQSCFCGRWLSGAARGIVWHGIKLTVQFVSFLGSEFLENLDFLISYLKCRVSNTQYLWCCYSSDFFSSLFCVTSLLFRIVSKAC